MFLLVLCECHGMYVLRALSMLWNGMDLRVTQRCRRVVLVYD